jgi:hypothetical protein
LIVTLKLESTVIMILKLEGKVIMILRFLVPRNDTFE